MSKKKSVFVTAIIAVMLAVITFAAYRLYMPVFIVLVGTLSGVGFMSSATMFCNWLERPSYHPQEDLDIIHFKATPHYGEEPESDYEMTYEQIKQEMEDENESKK